MVAGVVSCRRSTSSFHIKSVLYDLAMLVIATKGSLCQFAGLDLFLLVGQDDVAELFDREAVARIVNRLSAFGVQLVGLFQPLIENAIRVRTQV